MNSFHGCVGRNRYGGRQWWLEVLPVGIQLQPVKVWAVVVGGVVVAGV